MTIFVGYLFTQLCGFGFPFESLGFLGQFPGIGLNVEFVIFPQYVHTHCCTAIPSTSFSHQKFIFQSKVAQLIYNNKNTLLKNIFKLQTKRKYCLIP